MKPIYVRKGNYGFSTKLKNEYNGQTSEMYFDIQFSKSNTPSDSCKIEILDCFLTCYTGKDGVKPKLVVTNYKIVEEDGNSHGYITDSHTPKENTPSDTGVYFDDIKVDDEFENSLPF